MPAPSRTIDAREEWPFQPWPARRHSVGDWSSGGPDDSTPRSGGWSTTAFTALWAVAALAVAAAAGVAMVQLQAADADTAIRTMHRSPAGDARSEDCRVAGLVREHLRAVRGL